MTEQATKQLNNPAIGGGGGSTSSPSLRQSTSSRYNYAAYGDYSHVVLLAGCILHTFVVVSFMDDDDDNNVHDPSGNNTNNTKYNILDAAWRKEGFCVTAADKPYLTSHDVCLYLDFCLAVVLGGIYLTLYKRPGMEHANKYMLATIPGMIAHGIGHGTIAASLRSGGGAGHHGNKTPWDTMRQMDSVQQVALRRLLPGMVFWLGLVKSTMPTVQSNGLIAMVSMVAMFVGTFIPNKLGFVYVQTALAFIFSTNQMLHPPEDKGFAYALYPLVVGIPTVLVSWMECTLCSAFVRDYLYGHVVYDAIIPISTVAFYLICYLQQQREQRRRMQASTSGTSAVQRTSSTKTKKA